VSIAERKVGHHKAANKSEKGVYMKYPKKSNPNIREGLR
tara:strand:+ start:50 stop:166 length:117 start_codon:yes stop_codon:yes gene_type:complete